jgi:hypothetical protein
MSLLTDRDTAKIEADLLFFEQAFLPHFITI